MVSIKRSPLPCIEQPAWTSGSNYLPVGRHSSRPSEEPRLRPVDDRQHNSRRMAQKINFRELGKSPIQAYVRIKAAWKQATLFLSLGIKCYSQWFKVRETKFWMLSPVTMTGATKNSPMQSNPFAPQVPSHFKIPQLPKEITSWLTELLLKSPCDCAVERGTHKKQDRAWRRWKEYSYSIGIKDNLYLKIFSQEHRHIIMGKFAMAVREARFSRESHEQLAAGTVEDTMQYVCATFGENGYPNPSTDIDGQLAFILQQEFRLFKNTDPEEKHQKSIPISVISELIHWDSTNLEQATGKLATLGIFFAMRSCEYLKVAKPEQQRTKILRLRNVKFIREVEQLGHNQRELEFADCIALTFEWQKKDKKMNTVTLMASQDARLHPVRAAAAIMRRIRKYPGSSQDYPILTVTVNGHTHDKCVERCLGSSETVSCPILWGINLLHIYAREVRWNFEFNSWYSSKTCS
jgi:hypothetical protein